MSASASAASAMIDITVKSLAGDLVQLSVDPTLGLKGVETALTLFDSDVYAPFQFRVFFIDEEATEITQDAFLGVVVVQEPMAHLLEVIDSVTLPGTNASYSATYKVFKFKLSTPDHPYLYIYSYEKNGKNMFYPSLVPLRIAIHHWAPSDDPFDMSARPVQHDPLTRLYKQLITDSVVTISDAYIILYVIMFHYNLDICTGMMNKENEVYCECGCIVKPKSMAAHLKTKLKHKNGDEKGKAFLAHLKTYIKSL